MEKLREKIGEQRNVYEAWLSYRAGSITIVQSVAMGLGATFGIYFCFLVKEKLPAYYDENHISAYTDGIFEMNLTGLSLNNNNWGKILKVGRIYSVTIMLVYPIIGYIETLLFTGILRDMIDLYFGLFLTIGGFSSRFILSGTNIKKGNHSYQSLCSVLFLHFPIIHLLDMHWLRSKIGYIRKGHQIVRK